MQTINQVLEIPSEISVTAKVGSESHDVNQFQLLHIMLKVKRGELSNSAFKIFDIDTKGNEYEMIIREDGLFENEFTTPILEDVENADLIIELL